MLAVHVIKVKNRLGICIPLTASFYSTKTVGIEIREIIFILIF
jgi:hypothetical protein